MPTLEDLGWAVLSERERTVDVLNQCDPTAMTDFAIAHLESQGVKLVGDPTLVAFAKAEAIEKIEACFDHMDAVACERQRRVGRPRAPIERDAMAAAAYLRFYREGLGPTSARRAAAKLLGSTSSRIEKGTLRFFQRVTRPLSGVSAERSLKIALRYLHAVNGILDRCAEERATAGRLRRNSR